MALSKCEPLRRLTHSNQGISEAAKQRLRKAYCGFHGKSPKVRNESIIMLVLTALASALPRCLKCQGEGAD